MQKVAVIGAGTMGNGIAHVFAMKGHEVALVDVSEEALQRAMHTIERNLDRMIKKEMLTSQDKADALHRIHTFTELAPAVREATLAIEAATEQEDLKRRIFEQLDALAPPQAILATNTSSISITRIAVATSRPDRVIGMHFMNPVPVMKLVEVIRGYLTSDQTAQTIMEVSRKLGKTPVMVNDYPGFVANRLLMPMINEAIYALYEGVAGVEEIDTVMRLGMAHPMGPLHLADFIGLDVCLAILRVLHEGFGHPKYAPCPLLVNMVTAGKLGVKTGEGFYKYSPDSKEKAVSPLFAR